MIGTMSHAFNNTLVGGCPTKYFLDKVDHTPALSVLPSQITRNRSLGDDGDRIDYNSSWCAIAVIDN
jgi:hypothetical protein